MVDVKLEHSNMQGTKVVVPQTIPPPLAALAENLVPRSPASSPSPATPTLKPSAPRPAKRKVPEFNELEPEFVTISIIENGVPRQSACHRTLATYYSSYFREHFRGLRRAITLWDTTHNAFAIVMRFFYTEKIRDRSDSMPPSPDLVEAYLLADRLRIPKLQNMVLEGIERNQRQDGTIQTRLVPRIYSETLPGSPLRKLIAHQVATLRLKDFLAASEARPQYYPPALLVDVISVLRKASRLKVIDISEFMVPEA
ncbi:Ankyrin repeat, bromo and BTB domain-containing protein [Phlyctema vagabunda]|uniref:Ankyrin repeat, bromo and BTB domain-containing protein n=1 Tax=Phlyctema vagabunda TaxID=108571 RepID=A0ABR4P8J5_9HELO